MTGLGYFCKPCNQGVATVWDRFGPVHAEAALERATVASTMKGVCIFMPLIEDEDEEASAASPARDESDSDSDSDSESESEDESFDEVMPAKRARWLPKSRA